MLTAKQEKFAQGVSAGMSLADAYRAAYSAERMKPETVHVKAYELLSNGKITDRIEELRKPAAVSAQITLEGHLKQLEKMRDMALMGIDEAEKAGEKAALLGQAIKAQMAIGKDSGIIAPIKTEVQQKTEVTGDIGVAVLDALKAKYGIDA